MPRTRNWEKLLRFLYEHDEQWENFAKGDTGIDKTHPFVTEVDLDVSEAESSFSFLKRQELIEQSGAGYFQLTSKGFEVIRDQDFKRDQTRYSQAIVVFTVMLAIISILDIIATEITPNSLVGKIGLASISAILLISVYYLSRPYLSE